MKPLKPLPKNAREIPLREYHTSLPVTSRRDSVRRIADACFVSEAIVYEWLRGKKIRDIYKRTISEITQIPIVKL